MQGVVRYVDPYERRACEPGKVCEGQYGLGYYTQFDSVRQRTFEYGRLRLAPCVLRHLLDHDIPIIVAWDKATNRTFTVATEQFDRLMTVCQEPNFGASCRLDLTHWTEVKGKPKTPFFRNCFIDLGWFDDPRQMALI